MLALASCEAPDFGARVQIHVDTDAPVPGGEALGFPPALFDRVRIEVFPPGREEPCEGCTRVVPLEHATLAGGGISFGIGVPTGEEGTRVRATAYRSTAFPDGSPTAGGSLQVVVALPALDANADNDITVFLPTDQTGAPTSTLEDPRKPRAGRPEKSAVGTWKPAERTPCSGEPWPGQVCVPGGAFWLPAVFSQPHRATPPDQQLVVLSPFFVDATETTVRALLRSGLLTDDAVLAWSGDEEGAELGATFDWCTYSGNVERLDLPVTCVRPAFARSYCQAYGADLPTEAQIAYLIGGTASTAFPWGDDEPTCDDAWLARVALNMGTKITQALRLECSGLGFEPFRNVGTSLRDRVVFEDATVEDVAGNAAEITRDRFTGLDAPCWGPGVVFDPTCDPADDPSAWWTIRGGAIVTALAEGAAVRAPAPSDANIAEAGFRCVRPGDDLTPPPIVTDLVIGQGCNTDADCGASPEARCQSTDADWSVGGIVGGYCSRACSSDSQCGPAGICTNGGYCFLGCETGAPPLTHTDQLLSPTKCHGRRDLMCHKPTTASRAACLGACSSDGPCNGRQCHHWKGGCFDEAKQGLDDGAPCDFDGECKGVCVGYPGEKVCASACSAGGEIDSEDCGGSDKALCFAAGGFQSPGSLGFCYPACAAHEDCTAPRTFCMPVVGGPELEPPWWDVADAVCFPTSKCQNLGQSCGNGLYCTDTPHGPYCLDPQIPF